MSFLNSQRGISQSTYYRLQQAVRATLSPKKQWISSLLLAGLALSAQAQDAVDAKQLVVASDKPALNINVVEALATEVKPEEKAAASEKDKAADDADLGTVVVTSRNREEIAQDVPIPISVIGGKQLDRDRVLTVDDLTRKAPGLTATTPNARRTGISIRGIGKTSAGSEQAEAAVGVVVDDVYLSQAGMSYQDYTDLDRVEVLRGPQGTLKGKNTTIGALNYVSKAPSFTSQGSFEAELGGSDNRYNIPDGLKLKGSYTGALVQDVLAWRGSFFVDNQEGDLANINPVGGRWHEKDRFGGRLQLLWKASENVTAKLNIDVARANENSNTKPWITDPTTFANGSARTSTFSTRLSRSYFGGYQPIIGQDRVDTLDLNAAQPLKTNNNGISAIVDWNLGNLTLSSISAYRDYHFDAKNDSDQTQFDINRGGTLVDSKQYSQEFRLTSDIGDLYDYQTGLYFLKSETTTVSRTLYGKDAGAFYATTAQYNSLVGNTALLQQALNNVYVTNTQTPEVDSKAWYGQINWHLTDKATVTSGLRYTHENRNNSISKSATFYDGSALTALGDVNAQAIREAQTGTVALGTLYSPNNGEITENSLSWLLSPSYKLNNDVLFYASAAAGEKSSAVSFNSNNGTNQNVKPEQSLDFELGVKSLLLNHKLMLNVNLYNTIIKDYQATTSIPDPNNAGQYTSVFGNIPEITARGLELEGNYALNSNLSFNFGGAYNHAVYTDWHNATCPAELNTPTVTCDNTGKQIVGAPRRTAILGADYRVPLSGGFTGHAFFSTVIRSKQNLESLLSQYGEVAGYSVTDGGVGIIASGPFKYEVNLVAKNLFDKRYTTSVNNFSSTAPVGWDGLGAFRYVGLIFRTTF